MALEVAFGLKDCFGVKTLALGFLYRVTQWLVNSEEGERIFDIFLESVMRYNIVT